MFTKPVLHRLSTLGLALLLSVLVDPVAANANSALETVARPNAQPIVIGGPPVTVEVAPGEIVDLMFDYNGSGLYQVEFLSCTDTYRVHLELSGSRTLATGHQCDNPVIGPYEPRGPASNIIGIENSSEEIRTYTVRLTSVPMELGGRLRPGGDTLTVEVPARENRATHGYGAVWLGFSGIAGQEVGFDFVELGLFPCNPFFRGELRHPDLTTANLQSSPEDCLSARTRTLTLPQTGTYRLELYNPVIQDPETGDPVDSQAVSVKMGGEAPGECLGRRITPIMLVHGLNGSAADWDMFQPLLVDRLAREFALSGVDQAEAAVCADLFVHAVSLGPRDSIASNGILLLSETSGLRSQTGATKIDIIAHSKGGLDSRWAIKLLGNEDPVIRNLLMIATPNRGTPLADIACGLQSPLLIITSPALAFVAKRIEKVFGPCRGQHDALYNITEMFVQGIFNPTGVDSPNVVYQTIVGDSTCGLCRMAWILMADNDRLVPVISAMGPELFRYELRGVFDLDHDQIRTTEAVLERAYCSLVSRV